MRPPTPLDRRNVLAAPMLAGLAWAVRADAATPATGPAEAVEAGLLVAGPPGARLDRWAEPLSDAIGRALSARAPLVRRNLGGLDGVTGANAFDARVDPDGSTALLVPGAATLSWLVGETRARFDPARWLLLWAATAPAVLVSRAPPQPDRPLRVAASGPAGAELPALLALDLAGIYAAPTPAAEADAMLLQGAAMPALLRMAQERGMRPVMTLGQGGTAGSMASGISAAMERDPLLPATPSAMEMARDRASPTMLAALAAACLAVQLDAGLALPQLAPAGTVSNWRRACQSLSNDPASLAEAQQQGARMLSSAAAMDVMTHIAGNPAPLLSLRQWLAVRHGWQPA